VNSKYQVLSACLFVNADTPLQVRERCHPQNNNQARRASHPSSLPLQNRQQISLAGPALPPQLVNLQAL
jgi:hypothetical protein